MRQQFGNTVYVFKQRKNWIIVENCVGGSTKFDSHVLSGLFLVTKSPARRAPLVERAASFSCSCSQGLWLVCGESFLFGVVVNLPKLSINTFAHLVVSFSG
jgi:hypothetical protein